MAGIIGCSPGKNQTYLLHPRGAYEGPDINSYKVECSMGALIKDGRVNGREIGSIAKVNQLD